MYGCVQSGIYEPVARKFIGHISNAQITLPRKHDNATLDEPTST